MKMRFAVGLMLLGTALVSANTPLETTIERHREVASLARSTNAALFAHLCSSTILNNRSLLTSARCVELDQPERWLVRVGSTAWNSGGNVYTVSQITLHYQYDPWKMANDVAILRMNRYIVFGDKVQAGRYAGPNYIVSDNLPVAIAGWGYLSFPLLQKVEYTQLHELKQVTVNLDVCRPFYITEGLPIQNTTQLCTFSSSENPRDKCFGEPGSPVYHRGTIVGVRSYALGCAALKYTPTISTRVSSFIDWIVCHA